MRSSTDNEAQQGYDAGDPVSVGNKAKLAKVRDDRRVNGLKQIMSSADGRLWMWDFLSKCGLFAVRFTGNASKDAFDNGMRNAAMPMFAEIQTYFMPEYLLMVKENSNV